MSRYILGIDIRYDSVSAVLTKSTLGGNRLEDWDYIAISGLKEVETGITTCLQNLSDESALSKATCIVAFPARRISFRNLTVPFREKKKIRQILPYEIEPNLPYLPDDLLLDFYETDSAEQTKLLAAAVEKSEVDACLAVLSSHQIEPKVITVGDYALARCLNHMNGMPENCLFSNLDQYGSTICLVESGKIRFIRSFLLHPDDGGVKAASYCTEIKRTLYAFSESNPTDFHPSAFLLSGTGAIEASVRQQISRTLDIPVELPNLLQSVKITTADINHKNWDPARMDHALALTLLETEGIRILNFRKGPLAIQKHWVKYKQNIIPAAVLLGLIFIMSIAGVIIRSQTLKKQIVHLDTQITEIFRSSFPEVKKIVDPLQQMRIKLETARKELLYPDQGDIGIRRVELLNDISRLIPARLDVDFSRLVIGPESILISGNTDTFNSVNIIKSRLEQSSRFKDVTISSANIAKSDNRVQFKVRIMLGAPSGKPAVK